MCAQFEVAINRFMLTYNTKYPLKVSPEKSSSENAPLLSCITH